MKHKVKKIWDSMLKKKDLLDPTIFYIALLIAGIALIEILIIYSETTKP
jgi:hypothetical protein